MASRLTERFVVPGLTEVSVVPGVAPIEVAPDPEYDATKLTLLLPPVGAAVNVVGATALTLKTVPVLKTAMVPGDPPAACEFRFLKSVLGAKTPELPTVNTHVDVTMPVNGTLPVAACALDAATAMAENVAKADKIVRIKTLPYLGHFDFELTAKVREKNYSGLNSYSIIGSILKLALTVFLPLVQLRCRPQSPSRPSLEFSARHRAEDRVLRCIIETERPAQHADAGIVRDLIGGERQTFDAIANTTENLKAERDFLNSPIVIVVTFAFAFLRPGDRRPRSWRRCRRTRNKQPSRQTPSRTPCAKRAGISPGFSTTGN